MDGSCLSTKKKKPKGMKRGNKRERNVLMRFGKKKKGNHFQSGSTLSAAKYTEKSLMGRKQTELLFSLLLYGFITETHREKNTQRQYEFIC